MFVVAHFILIVDKQKVMKLSQYNNSWMVHIIHELAHIFLGSINTRLPIWLEEGICEYYSKQYNTFGFLNPENKIRPVNFKQIESLIQNSYFDASNAETKLSLFYWQSHSFVRFLVKYWGEKKISDCIQSAGLKYDFYFLFNRIYSRSFEKIEKEWLLSLGLSHASQ